MKKANAQGGFSLIEAMVGAVILGFGLIGLAELHISSIRGTVKSEEQMRGAEVARIIADNFATQPFQQVTNQVGGCPPGPLAAPGWTAGVGAGGGCKRMNSGTNTFNGDLGAGCTAYFSQDALNDLNDPTWFGDPMQGDVAGPNPPPGNWDFRVDVRMSAHPNQAHFPSLGANPTAVLWVWVCYTEENGNVVEFGTNRVIAENM